MHSQLSQCTFTCLVCIIEAPGSPACMISPKLEQRLGAQLTMYLPNIQEMPHNLSSMQEAPHNLPSMQEAPHNLPDMQGASHNLPDMQGVSHNLPSMQEAPHNLPSMQEVPHKLYIMVHACNLNIWELEAGESEVRAHSQLHSKLKASLDSIKSCSPPPKYYNHWKKFNAKKKFRFPPEVCLVLHPSTITIPRGSVALLQQPMLSSV